MLSFHHLDPACPFKVKTVAYLQLYCMSFFDTGSRSPEAPEGVLAWADPLGPAFGTLLAALGDATQTFCFLPFLTPPFLSSYWVL